MHQSYQSQGKPIDQVKQAVLVTNGEDCAIASIEDNSQCIGTSFPGGTMCFLVHWQKATCTHNPRCRYINHVFNYNNMTLVLTPADSEQISVATIKRLLLNE